MKRGSGGAVLLEATLFLLRLAWPSTLVLLLKHCALHALQRCRASSTVGGSSRVGLCDLLLEEKLSLMLLGELLTREVGSVEGSCSSTSTDASKGSRVERLLLLLAPATARRTRLGGGRSGVVELLGEEGVGRVAAGSPLARRCPASEGVLRLLKSCHLEKGGWMDVWERGREGRKESHLRRVSSREERAREEGRGKGPPSTHLLHNVRLEALVYASLALLLLALRHLHLLLGLLREAATEVGVEGRRVDDSSLVLLLVVPCRRPPTRLARRRAERVVVGAEVRVTGGG